MDGERVDESRGFEPLEPQRLTWAVLLGRWVEFARSAVALPTRGEGGRLRGAVPDLIQLQAVWFALETLEELDEGERAVGLDRAGVLVERHAAALRRRWEGEPLPAELSELVAEAEASLRKRRDG